MVNENTGNIIMFRDSQNSTKCTPIIALSKIGDGKLHKELSSNKFMSRGPFQ